MCETINIPQRIDQCEIVYQNKVQTTQRIVAHFKNFSKEYYVETYGKRSALLVIQNKQILLTRQYRLLINNISLEIPGGKVQENETPVQAAMRECYEETGVKVKHAKELLSYHPSLDIWNNYTAIFISQEIEKVDEDKAEKRMWINCNDCFEMVFNGEIQDSLSIITLLAYFYRNNNNINKKYNKAI